MKRSITMFTVLLAVALFTMPTHAGQPSLVTGSVEVVNTPNVYVTNTPDVNVVSMPDSIEKEPFQMQQDRGFSGGTGTTYDFYTVPAGKRLVIEFVSTAIDLTLDYDVREFEILIDDGTNQTFHFAPPLVEVYNDASVPGAYYKGSQKVLIHADQEEKVKVHFSVNQGGGEVSSSTTMSGYLIPLSLAP